MKIDQIPTGWCCGRVGHPDDLFLKLDPFLRGKTCYQAVDLKDHAQPIYPFPDQNTSPNLPQDDLEIRPRPWEPPANTDDILITWEKHYDTAKQRDETKVTVQFVYRGISVKDENRPDGFYLVFQTTEAERQSLEKFLKPAAPPVAHPDDPFHTVPPLTDPDGGHRAD